MSRSLSKLHSRHLRQLARASYGDEALVTKVGKGILREYDFRIEKSLKVIARSERSTNHYIELLRRYKKVFARAMQRTIKATRAVIKTRNTLFKDLDATEFDKRINALMRVPIESFVDFDKLDISTRSERMLELVDEYQNGNNGCGFAPNLLLMPGQYSPHLTQEAYDTQNPMMSGSGFKKLPVFIYQLIDAFIAEALVPDFSKKIFFKETMKITKKWGDFYRQTRSDGRLGMVKVFIVLAKRLDYRVSMRIGKRIKEKETGKVFFRGILREDIATEANMSLDSVKTALRNLEQSGILYDAVKQYDDYICPKTHVKKYHALAIVRKMKSSIIEALGLAESKRELAKDARDNGLGHQRSDAYVKAKELTEKEKKATEKERVLAVDELKALGLM